eukprot:TRINITY_DN50051_c0_g1_i1.p1 TRINITY_DN50051_c0_g1~~TRINITY_DN50051_c0_g1_i1.p1  ORF type:complete len:276 (+),score=107.17 TRINITY_DN50051_c0_g1_i1:83-829(+)
MVDALRAAVAELEGMLGEAKHPRVTELLQGGVQKLRDELTAAEAAAADRKAQEEAEAAAAQQAAAERAAAAAKAKAEKEKKEQEEKERKEREKAEKAAAKAAAAAAPGEDITTKSGLTIKGEVSQAMKKLKFGGRDPKPTAVLLGIDKEGLTVVLDQVIEDAKIEDIQEEMPDIEPRYIFYSYTKTMPDGRVKTPLVFIFYSPSCAPAHKSMAATRWKTEVGKCFDVTKTLEVRDVDDFTQEWFDEVS